MGPGCELLRRVAYQFAIAGGRLIHLRNILCRGRRALDLRDEPAIRRNDDVGWQCRNAIEPRRARRIVPGIELNQDKIRFQSARGIGTREDFLVDPQTGLAPRRPKMNEDQPIRLCGDLAGRFEVRLPWHLVFAMGHGAHGRQGDNCI